MTVELDDETESRLLDRAEYIEEAVTILAEKQSLAPEDYRSNREHRAIVEREFQTAIEACIDIAGILIAALDEQMPETNADRFVRLVELDILPKRPADGCGTPRDFGTSLHTDTVTRSTTT